MATNNPNPNLSEFESQPSSDAKHSSLFLPFDVAIKGLPMCLQFSDDCKQHELSLFLSQVDQFHNPEPHENYSAALSILNYIQNILECAPESEEVTNSQQGTRTRSEAFAKIPNVLRVPLPDITEDIASEIASKVIDDVDPHSITMSLLSKLQEYCWEVKVVLTVTTFILTFGNFGLNLCSQSKVSLDNSPMIVKQLLQITSFIVKLTGEPDKDDFMRWKSPYFREVKTTFVVAAYFIIRVVVENAAFYIKNNISSCGYKFGTDIATPGGEKLDDIRNYLMTGWQQRFDSLCMALSDEVKPLKSEEDEKMLRVWFHFPGLTAEDIQIYCGMSGFRMSYLTVYAVYPSFVDRGIVSLPNDAVKKEIKALFNKHGMLCISVPKEPEFKEFRIPVTPVSYDL